MPKNSVTIRDGVFEPSDEGKKHIKYAERAIKAVVEHAEIDPVLKPTLIKFLIWQITEAHSKYHIRYRSGGVRNDRKLKEKVEHEHVYEIKWLTTRLLDSNVDFDELFGKIVACVVTKDEHEQLKAKGKGLVGWKRYEKAGIDVYDMSSSNPTQVEF